MSVFMQPIYTQTVTGSPVASITFNNIPQGFSDLYILISTRMTNSSTLGYTSMRFNDNTTNYSWTYLDANIGSTPFSSRAVNYSSWFVNTPAANSTANVFGNSWVRINDYVGGGFKQGILSATGENNATGGAWLTQYAALFSNNAPITKITFQDVINSANFAVGSTITIYGVSERYDTATPTAPTIGTVTDLAEFASVAFTPASNDQADRYAVTTTPSSSTTFGTGSPIVAPAALNTSYTYQVAAVNSLGSGSSSASTALTTYNSYASIATANATGSESSITFSNIPQNYKHIEIRAHVRCTGAGSGLGNFVVRFNGDSGINYNYSTIYGNRSGVPSQSTTFASAQAYLGTCVPQNSATTNAFGGFVANVVDYTSTSKIKIVKSLAGGDIVSSGTVSEFSSLWNSTAPITSMTFYAEGNFANYSSIALYGIA